MNAITKMWAIACLLMITGALSAQSGTTNQGTNTAPTTVTPGSINPTQGVSNHPGTIVGIEKKDSVVITDVKVKGDTTITKTVIKRNGPK